jgi:hypothetical protein
MRQVVGSGIFRCRSGCARHRGCLILHGSHPPGGCGEIIAAEIMPAFAHAANRARMCDSVCISSSTASAATAPLR